MLTNSGGAAGKTKTDGPSTLRKEKTNRSGVLSQENQKGNRDFEWRQDPLREGI